MSLPYCLCDARYKKGARFPFVEPAKIPQKFFEWMSDDLLVGREQGLRDDIVRKDATSIDISISVELASGQNEDVGLDYSDASMIIEWGSGDAADESSVEVDLIHGTSLCLPAKSAIFRINYPPIEAQGLVQPKLDVSVSVGVGATGASGNRPPRRTVKIGATDGGQPSAVKPVPRYAHGAVLQTKDALATAILKQYGSAAAGASQLLAEDDALVKPEFQSVPIANGARGFTVTTAQNATGVAVIFFLAPG